MAAKKKSSAQDQWNKAVKSGAIRPVKSAPVEAVSKPGTAKPTGGKTKTTALPAPKTPVITDISRATLRGSGTPLATSIAINPDNRSQKINALLTIAGTKGSGQIIGKISSKVGAFVSGHAFDAASRGLTAASGQGGRIKNVMTPFGRTIAGTKIGSAAEQSARIENLLSGAAKTAKIAGGSAAKQTAVGLGRVAGAGRMAAGAALVTSATKKVNKTRKK